MQEQQIKFYFGKSSNKSILHHCLKPGSYFADFYTYGAYMIYWDSQKQSLESFHIKIDGWLSIPYLRFLSKNFTHIFTYLLLGIAAGGKKKKIEFVMRIYNCLISCMMISFMDSHQNVGLLQNNVWHKML